MLATVKEEHDGSGALRNLPATTMPSTAHVAYLCEQGTWIGAHEKSRAKSVLVEENGAMVRGGNVEVLRGVR